MADGLRSFSLHSNRFSRSNFRAITRLETLATQAKDPLIKINDVILKLPLFSN